jgi:hypothetical protein
MPKIIPVEILIVLQNQLDELPARHAKRRLLVEDTATSFNVSISTVRRALKAHHQPQSTHRKDFNHPRVTTQEEMTRYCELIAALRFRTTNKKGRQLSILECIRLLEQCGVETKQGLIVAPKGLLKRSTVSRYIKRWGYDNRSICISPPYTSFQAVYSNDCWQFDFSPSDLKKIADCNTSKDKGSPSKLMLAGVVDDRSGNCYQAYHIVKGEDTLTALRFLFNAMAPKENKALTLQGIPKMIYLDSGPVAKSKLFKRVMAHLGVEVRVHMPKGSDGRRVTARSKGKIERSFRTIKDAFETLYHFHEPESLEQANEWLHQYLVRYNNMLHREEPHSRKEDWLNNLPAGKFREMCNWERFCRFAREPENRKADSNGCVEVEGIRYQLDYNMAGEDVVLLWGVFDNELFVEFNEERFGPFYPESGAVNLGTFRHHEKSTKAKQADKIEALAQTISIPISALSGQTGTTKSILSEAKIIREEAPQAIPFDEPDPFDQRHFKNRIEAKTAIAKFLGRPLARLPPEELTHVNNILEQSLEKTIVMAEVKAYFTLSLNSHIGGSECTGK